MVRQAAKHHREQDNYAEQETRQPRQRTNWTTQHGKHCGSDDSRGAVAWKVPDVRIHHEAAKKKGSRAESVSVGKILRIHNERSRFHSANRRLFFTMVNALPRGSGTMLAGCPWAGPMNPATTGYMCYSKPGFDNCKIPVSLYCCRKKKQPGSDPWTGYCSSQRIV